MTKKTSKKKERSPEFEYFLKTPLKRHKGKYVAILGKKIVASGDDVTLIPRSVGEILGFKVKTPDEIVEIKGIGERGIPRKVE